MNRILSLIAVSAALALLSPAGHAEAGRFLSVVGDVRVVAVDGRERAVSQGSEVDSGETVLTGDGGFAQLRMSDGARLQVREDSELKLDDYAYEEQGAGRMFMSLLRGTMRSLTGLIGSRRKESYGVRTPHATIGIRGTDHQVTVLLRPRDGFEPGTFDVVFTGGTVMRTDAGRIDISPQQAGYVSSRAVVPRVIPVPAFLQPGAAAAPRTPAVVRRRADQDEGASDGKQNEAKGDARSVVPDAKAAVSGRTEVLTAPAVKSTTTLRTPLSDTLRTPLSTPLSGSSLTTRTLSPDVGSSTTLAPATGSLDGSRLESVAPTSIAPSTLTPSTTTTRTLSPTLSPSLLQTAPTLTPSLSTTTKLPTTTSTTIAPTTTVAPKLVAPTTSLPTRIISPTTTR